MICWVIWHDMMMCGSSGLFTFFTKMRNNTTGCFDRSSQNLILSDLIKIIWHHPSTIILPLHMILILLLFEFAQSSVWWCDLTEVSLRCDHISSSVYYHIFSPKSMLPEFQWDREINNNSFHSSFLSIEMYFQVNPWCCTFVCMSIQPSLNYLVEVITTFSSEFRKKISGKFFSFC